METENSRNVPGRLVYEGEIINARAEMLSLTDMWRAAKSPDTGKPADWQRKEGASFIEAVAVAHNMPEGHIIATKRGKGGSTFAHWQIALAYAKYLSPEFHMWCNTVVRERMEGKSHAETHVVNVLGEGARRAIGGIVKSGNGVQTGELERFIVGVLERTIPTMVEQRLLADTRRAAVSRDPALAFLTEAGAMQKRRGHLARRLSRALCALDPMETHRIRCANTHKWLFDRDFAKQFMRQAGNAWVSDHNNALKGQGLLKLVQPKPKEEPLAAS